MAFEMNRGFRSREQGPKLFTEEELEAQEKEELQDLKEDTRIRMKERRTHRKTKKEEKETK
jgi:hypothetical protein